MILDDQIHEDGYLVKDGVIYYHGKIFLSRSSKLKAKLPRRAYEEFCLSHTYSMRFYNIIMRGYTWKGFEGELHQHLPRCINHVELGKQNDSIKELSHPSLSSYEKGDRSMHHSNCLRRNFGGKYAHVNNVSFDYCLHSFTMYILLTPCN